jgi:hypothetical protein
MLKRLAEKLKGHAIIDNCFDEDEIKRVEHENVSDFDATTINGGALNKQILIEPSSYDELFSQ